MLKVATAVSNVGGSEKDPIIRDSDCIHDYYHKMIGLDTVCKACLHVRLALPHAHITH